MSFHPYNRAKQIKPVVQDPVSVVKFKTPSIAPNEVEFEVSIGKGSFGEVFKGTCRGQVVAVKVLNKQNLPEKALREFEREVILISKYTHPNIVQFMGACFVPDHMMIVTEFIPRGDLEDMLADSSIKLSMTTRMKMAKGAALGMNWLHLSEHTFIHRDLKTKNLLVGEGNIIKICDFGLSQVKQSPDAVLRDPPNGAKGTPIWMAPEILMNREFNEKCDIYSFGLILWCLLTRNDPYAEYEDLQTFRNDICKHHIRPIIPRDCLPSLRDLIQRCWHKDPSQRPDFATIIKELDYIIIDYSIFDFIGRKIWVQHFLSQEKVSWHEFLPALQNEIELYQEIPSKNFTQDQIMKASDYQLEAFSAKSPRDIQRIVEQEFKRRYPNGKPNNILSQNELRENHFSACLESLLAIRNVEDGITYNDPVVTIEKFGEILNWFGPILDPNTNEICLYDNVLNILRQPWFHGDINQSVAEDRIRGTRVTGSFLVRFSSMPGYFTISQATNNEIEHRRISHGYGNPFEFGGITSPTLVGLIALIAEPLGLKHACPGSRFTKIFNSGNGGAYIQSGGYIQSSDRKSVV